MSKYIYYMKQFNFFTIYISPTYCLNSFLKFRYDET